MVFNLKCDVKRKTEPLSLNIKATGYSMSVSVRCEDSNGGVTELSAQEVNVIDFKEVSSSSCSTRSCKISARSFTDMFEEEGRCFIGSLRSEKTAKMTESNHQPTPTMPTAHVPQCHIPVVLGHLQGQYSPISLGSCATASLLFWSRIVPDIQPEPSLVQLEAITTHLLYVQAVL